ncbi:MAG: DNA polymerase III subunit gamma/tau [Chloroflexi bacterium]|nr:DNA polymerase III subunit gamma/tau [Chloroflexota bacterium]
MSAASQVLYRKWRSGAFRDLVGQDHVTHTLRRAVAEGKISHAYLFTGPRGTGKTSSARILAKALNCLNPSDGEPDEICSNCVAVTEGRNLDVIEIDAASNNGIDNIRDLRDKVQFTPGTGQYKVYIIDEVHMLSGPAFNALLKTLEEPPQHAIFVMATTESDKVPATIISRCQRYDFRRIANQDVVDRLKHVADAEGFTCEEDALQVIARVAWGSLRDALNLLEQIAISYQGNVTAEAAQELLGLGDTGASIKLAEALLSRNAAAGLATVNEQAAAGRDLKALQSSTIETLRAALLIKTGVDDALSHPAEVVEAMREATKSVDLDQVLRSLSAISETKFRDDSSSPLPLELAVARAVSAPRVAAAPAPVAPPAAASTRQPARPPAPRPTQSQQAPPRQAPATPAAPATQQQPAASYSAPPAETSPAPPARPKTPSDDRWDQVIRALNRTKGKKFVLGPLMRGASSHEVVGDELILQFTHNSNAERMAEELGDPRGRIAVEDAVEAAFGVKLGVKAQHGATDSSGDGGTPKATDSPLVRAAMAMGARIIEDSNADTSQ